MDTRRRSDSRERLAASPSTDRQPADDDLGSETRVVRLSDMQPVAERRGGVPPTFIVGMVAVAILGFALGAESRNLTPSASPVPSVVAVASASPFVGATATGPAGPTGLPTVAPTARPTTPPPWAWTRSELAPDLISSAIGVWSLGSRIVVVGRRDFPNGAVGSWATAILEPGRAWSTQTAPRVIEDLTAGTVIDGRLTFLARTSGIDLHPQWQLVSTADGETWDAIAPAQGLGVFDAVNFIAQRGSTWLASTQAFGDNGNDVKRLLRSDDGVHWSDVSLPDLGSVVEFEHLAVLGDTMLLTLRAGTNDLNHETMLASTNGSTWREASFPSTLDLTSGLSCSDTTCVLTGFEFEVPAMPAAWISTDAKHWAESSTTIADTSGAGITNVVPTASGFLGLEMDPRLAWLSSADGATWRSFDVMPADGTDQIYGLAVAGDVIVALANGPEGQLVVWRGNLGTFPD